MLRELRLALRRLNRQRGFTALAVLILALGLGATTTMFSLVSAAMRPMTLPDPDRLVRVNVGVGSQASGYLFFPPFVFRHLRAHNDLFDGMAAIQLRRRGLGAPGQPPQPAWTLDVTADFFPLLGMGPALGRVFLPEEDQPGRNRVVVLSHGAWQERFGGDPGIVGRSLQLGAQTVTVVGVMPAAFSDPVRRWSRPDLWRPMGLSAAAMDADSGQNLVAWARLKPGVTRDVARARLTALAARLDDGQRREVLVNSLDDKLGLDDEMQVAGWLALGLAMFVLLIACTNLVGVQLARLAGRSHEQAVRVALGATRGRLVREALAESLLVSLAGAALGILLAVWAAPVVGQRLVLDDGPQLTLGMPVALHPPAVLFALGAALLCTLIVGSAPAWLGARVAAFDTLRKGGHGATGGARPRLRQLLVVAQMAMALVLLMGGGLFLRGLQRMERSDPGWQVAGLMTGELTLSGPRYDEPGARAAFLERLQQRLAALPGVGRAALAGWVPVEGGSRPSFLVEGQTVAAGMRDGYLDPVSPEYFATLGITLRQGRPFSAADGPGALPVAIINESMARQLWPRVSPLGRRIALAVDDPSAPPAFKAWRTIVGVVSDIAFPGRLAALETRFQIYQPVAQALTRNLTLALRTSGPGAVSPHMIRTAVAQLDPTLVVNDTLDARALMNRELANFSLTGWVMLVLALLGLLLSALGVYGLFSGLVAERTREIGVRMALGAARGQVMAMMLGKGLRLATLAALLGMLGALAVMPLLRSVAYELPAHEPAAIVLLAALLVAVAVMACWLPARRAAALQPMAALRQD
jgi:putative ABC transport system permease protein